MWFRPLNTGNRTSNLVIWFVIQGKVSLKLKSVVFSILSWQVWRFQLAREQNILKFSFTVRKIHVDLTEVPEENLSFRPLPCGYPGNLCLIASVRGMHCANGPTVFLFKTKIIKHLKWANKWPRKPNVCFSFILSRINLCYCCRKPVPRLQSSSWTTDVFYSSSLIASGHLFVCAGGGKDTRVSNMIMWLFGVSAITTQLNTQSLTG